ncbi:MAG: DUF1048 domain-containing protein [Bacilli bacterium]
MSFQEILENKKIWRENISRTKSFPKDYQIMYKQIQKYFFKIGVEDMEIYFKVIEFLEEGISLDVSAVDYIGIDVANFCDKIIKDTK